MYPLTALQHPCEKGPLSPLAFHGKSFNLEGLLLTPNKLEYIGEEYLLKCNSTKGSCFLAQESQKAETLISVFEIRKTKTVFQKTKKGRKKEYERKKNETASRGWDTNCQP